MPQDLESPIGQPSAWVLIQVEMLQLRHIGQVQQPVVGELPGTAETQRRHVIKCSDARQHRVRHQPAGIEPGDHPLFHDRDEFVPFALGQVSTREILLSAVSIA